jgi:hypothetical protein
MTSTSSSLPRDGAGRWATASLSGAPDTSPVELDALGDHYEHCRGGALFRARCLADSVVGFLAPRLVTTAVVVAIVVAIVLGVASLIG